MFSLFSVSESIIVPLTQSYFVLSVLIFKPRSPYWSSVFLVRYWRSYLSCVIRTWSYASCRVYMVVSSTWRGPRVVIFASTLSVLAYVETVKYNIPVLKHCCPRNLLTHFTLFWLSRCSKWNITRKYTGDFCHWIFFFYVWILQVSKAWDL